MKETRLQEDAYIYKRREEPDEKQKWKDLDGAGKLQYFKDYYLKKADYNCHRGCVCRKVFDNASDTGAGDGFVCSGN